MKTPDGVEFEISIIGEQSNKQYMGKFRAKEHLSFRDQLNVDKVRRDLIGPNAQGADGEAMAIATMVAELSIRLTEAPIFWTESKGGLELYDSNVLLAVYDEAMKVQKAAIEEVQKAGEKAQAQLKEMMKSKD